MEYVKCSSLQSLSRHKKLHQNLKKHCDICKTEVCADRNDNYKRHVKACTKKAAAAAPKVFECKPCGKTFSTKQHLDGHNLTSSHKRGGVKKASINKEKTVKVKLPKKKKATNMGKEEWEDGYETAKEIDDDDGFSWFPTMLDDVSFINQKNTLDESIHSSFIGQSVVMEMFGDAIQDRISVGENEIPSITETTTHNIPPVYELLPEDSPMDYAVAQDTTGSVLHDFTVV